MNGTGKIVFRNSSGEFVEITVTEEEITVDRRHAGQSSFQQEYEKESYGLNRAPRQLRDSSEIEIIFDKCILEVLADNGLTPFTVSVFPLQPYEKICVTGMTFRQNCFTYANSNYLYRLSGSPGCVFKSQGFPSRPAVLRLDFKKPVRYFSPGLPSYFNCIY